MTEAAVLVDFEGEAVEEVEGEEEEEDTGEVLEVVMKGTGITARTITTTTTIIVATTIMVTTTIVTTTTMATTITITIIITTEVDKIILITMRSLLDKNNNFLSPKLNLKHKFLLQENRKKQ